MYAVEGQLKDGTEVAVWVRTPSKTLQGRSSRNVTLFTRLAKWMRVIYREKIDPSHRRHLRDLS